MLNLCILDADTLGHDVDLSPLQHLGHLSIFPQTAPEEVIERIKEQDIIITNKVVLNEKNLSYAPRVKLICITATGTNNVDLNYTKSRHITVTNVAGYSTYSVVQHTFGMLFYLMESLNYYDNYVKSGLYAQSTIFTHLGRPFNEIRGKTWGIIGLGTIGSEVARIATAFGCQVIYYSTSGQNYNPLYSRVGLEELLAVSDIVSIHCPLNEKTKNLITYQELSLMKKSAYLLNLGRGGIINEADLAKALDEDLIAGAALDVLEKEPAAADNPLLAIKNKHKLLITPHIAWSSREARAKLIEEVRLNIEAYLKGTPRNVV
ncbi:glycerate dehydrogenase [Thermosyntropha lipolytica DSM 11003]|uniref:Glycerate dehydrogenase n=1 Tax=Thermosyntropha lipolytica DSM 11003 TaxID=1123382 RepID=A0A1M5LDC0_9FIRM|nr:D-2-hydroxyacid dehydrogenase [Thermosyntropha lipolytica]SHG63102.1 glycerate dehydrogenase [Thermosyntropha lipolytica DSM 11003]